MALTRSFTSVVDARLAREPAFRDALLRESVDTMLTGDVDAGKAILRRYVEGTVGFAALGEALGEPRQAVECMFVPGIDVDAGRLFRVLGQLQKLAGLRLHVAA